MNHDNLEVYKVYIEDEGMEIRRATRTMALHAALHCLLGCGLGEVTGMILGTLFGWHNAITVGVSIGLAFIFAYALSVRSLLGGGVRFGAALRVAVAADTLSIATMEAVDNVVVLMVPGALGAGLANGLFWGGLALGLGAAFLAVWPLNYYLLVRGRGHALLHRHSH